IQLPVLAVAIGLCKATRQFQSIFPKDWFEQRFTKVFDAWKLGLASQGKKDLPYLPFPIHPFQWPFIQERFANALAEGHIIHIPGVAIPAQATMSVRTLIPLVPGKPYLKLPLNIQTTSMVRTHSPPRVHAGPLLSRTIERILQRDVTLSAYLQVVPEPIGIYIDDADYFQHSQNPSYFLNVLFRENPLNLLRKDEIHLPLSALFEVSPFSQQLLFLDIVEANGVNSAEDAFQYFYAYAWKVIRAQVGLYVGYGIALEGHQQNTWLVLDGQGKLTRTLVGDLAGGVEIYEPLLVMTGFDVYQDLHPVQKHMFSEGEIPEQQILHTTFNYHLIPLAIILSKNYNISFKKLLQTLADMIRKTINYYRSDTRHIVLSSDVPRYLQELDRIERVFLLEDIQVRSLLRMGLADTQKNMYTPSPNPFRNMDFPL
ncbi:MAG: IucA/IucC family siderophore biosynthesis protein, partial [Bacteroidota bacterium]